jgi:hypothetical protein
MRDQGVRALEVTRQNVVVQEGITEHEEELAEEPQSRSVSKKYGR